MRQLTNPTEFCQIHKNNRQLIEAIELNSNIHVRFFLVSCGFKGTREAANTILNLIGEQSA